jgi:hypothetical protein
MAFHADQREGRSQQPRGEGSEFNVKQSTSPMREDGWLIGYGTATARYDAPALERSHATRPAALGARPCLRPGALIVPEITSIVRRPLTRPAPQLGEDPLSRRGCPCRSL